MCVSVCVSVCVCVRVRVCLIISADSDHPQPREHFNDQVSVDMKDSDVSHWSEGLCPSHQHVDNKRVDSPDLDGVQGVAGGSVHRHFAHDEHHDLSSLVIWKVPTEEACEEQRPVTSQRSSSNTVWSCTDP